MTSNEPPVRDGSSRRTLRHSAFWFIIVGLINNGTTYALFVVLTLIGVQPFLAVSITYVAGMFISFFGNRRLTFQHDGRTAQTVTRFLLVNAFAYGVNIGILALFVSRLDFPPIPVQFGAVIVVAAITFFSMRLWVFRVPASIHSVERSL